MLSNDRAVSKLGVVMVLALVPAIAACGSEQADDPPVDVDAVLEQSADYLSTHELANPTPVLGSHGAMMQVWLQPEHLAAYLSIIPSPRPELEFPEGTLIVKEHLDLDNGAAVIETTIMYKGPAGYNPEGGGWWYAKLDADGEVLISGTDLPNCVDCHASAAASDWIYGLPQ
jgi:hypothetical protein